MLKSSDDYSGYSGCDVPRNNQFPDPGNCPLQLSGHWFVSEVVSVTGVLRTVLRGASLHTGYDNTPAARSSER